ncbi:hypothetical protein [Deinococcus radiophilus]|uniref:Uncharacterized protein n=1 Tax=Deinococcus radiophilus TaxID=32062 RepID=A0A3S0I9M2_9DEIO|nr:hypothetical protein [Deinococcus radiophilus]RTR27775.1 hypothetical protein EJ104_06240 [Deinococcus radiophilus]UFA50096.1 hypothetical protein LMT64_09460 [Deinococcus radiophilus]
MDFNSWRPTDTARRFAIMFAVSVGTFACIAAWLAYEQAIWLALLIGVLVAAVVYGPLYLGLKLYFER